MGDFILQLPVWMIMDSTTGLQVDFFGNVLFLFTDEQYVRNLIRPHSPIAPGTIRKVARLDELGMVLYHFEQSGGSHVKVGNRMESEGGMYTVAQLWDNFHLY